MPDPQSIALLDAFRAAKANVQNQVETLRDQAWQLRLDAEMKDRQADYLVKEANEHPLVKPDL
jgi:hypothetical protein